MTTFLEGVDTNTSFLFCAVVIGIILWYKNCCCGEEGERGCLGNAFCCICGAFCCLLNLCSDRREGESDDDYRRRRNREDNE